MGEHRTGVRAVALAIVVAASTLVASGCQGRSSATATSAPPAESATTEGGTGSVATTTPADSIPEAVAPSSDVFTRRRAVLYDRDGDPCEVCLWIADTAEERQTGLMGVTTLGDADGMAFLYDPPTDTSFWMKDTVIELDIVFFNADGESVGSAQMTPCTGSNCELYGPDTRFSTAVEFAVGHLAALGISDLAGLEILDAPCGLGL